MTEQELIELDKADLSLVYMHKGYPHCKRHGAMNSVNVFHKDGHRYFMWRCLSYYCSNPEDMHLKPEQRRIVENACRAGCITHASDDC